jgi:hypothetical protein
MTQKEVDAVLTLDGLKRIRFEINEIENRHAGMDMSAMKAEIRLYEEALRPLVRIFAERKRKGKEASTDGIQFDPIPD